MSADAHPFSLSSMEIKMRQFRADLVAVVPAPEAGHPRRKQPFVHFIPLAWLAAAARITASKFALHVAILLYYRKGITRREPVFVSSKLLVQFGVDRHGFYRALRSLETANLVSVERRKGRKPLITIVALS
ncbi:MAG TPA: hypothetical protein VNW92_17285, partial [Polyangiaceae bacterium]|nr:hypothetical protein [Polyangiaceae bacterium]